MEKILIFLIVAAALAVVLRKIWLFFKKSGTGEGSCSSSSGCSGSCSCAHKQPSGDTEILTSKTAR